MTKHVADQPKSLDAAKRAKVFVQMDKAKKPSVSTLALQRRARAADASRLKAYSKIDRSD